MTTADLDGCKEPVDVLIGLRQEAESCVLFNYWLDTVIRLALHEIEMKYPDAGIRNNYAINNENTNRSQRANFPSRGSTVTRLIMYADDIMTVAKSKPELE